eukprot:COSAG02_NODE_37926_length_435_cov_1.532738_1_plen_23_part_10
MRAEFENCVFGCAGTQEAGREET